MPVAVKDAHVRRVREQTGADSGTIVIDLDRDERRSGGHPGDDPGRADTRPCPDLGELAVWAGCGERTEETTDLANRRALEAQLRRQRFSAANELRDLAYDGVTR
jgi:hypothetical protein